MKSKAVLSKLAIATWGTLLVYVGISGVLLANYNPKVLAEPGATTPPEWALQLYDFMRPFWLVNWLIVPALLALSGLLTFLWVKAAQSTKPFHLTGTDKETQSETKDHP